MNLLKNSVHVASHECAHLWLLWVGGWDRWRWVAVVRGKGHGYIWISDLEASKVSRTGVWQDGNCILFKPVSRLIASIVRDPTSVIQQTPPTLISLSLVSSGAHAQGKGDKARDLTLTHADATRCHVPRVVRSSSAADGFTPWLNTDTLFPLLHLTPTSITPTHKHGGSSWLSPIFQSW